MINTLEHQQAMVHIFPVAFTNNKNGVRPTTNVQTTSYVWLLTTVACLGGLLFGYDTGIVSSAMLFLPDNNKLKPLSTLWQEVLISITPGMAGISALAAGKGSDKFGRRIVILSASAFFIVGTLICSSAMNRWMLLLGRILLGVAIGFASMIVPVYIGEGSPLHVRGTLVTIYQLSIAFGFVVANGIGAWFAHYDPENLGWRLMFGFAVVPALIQFIAFIFLPETPRFLAKQDDEKQARKVLNKIYNGDQNWVDYEIKEILKSAVEEKEYKQTVGDDMMTLVRILKTPHVLKAVLLGCSLQMFQQLTGINTIMYYTGTIVRSAGIKNKITNIWISCAISAVQVVGTFPPLKLIDKLGRRLLLLISSLTTVISLCLIGGSFFLIAANSEKINLDHAYEGIKPGIIKNSTIVYCASFKNCDACVTAETCGFCFSSNSKHYSQCLPLNHEDRDHSLVGYCQNSSSEQGFIYADSYCVTKYTALPIVLIVVYLMCYASGFGPIPWVYNAEIYPLWARSTCVSLSTFTNWMFSLIISLTFLTLSQTMTKGGAFFFYASISFVGLIIFYFFLPETRGCQFEEIEMLFMSENAKKQCMSEKNCEDNIVQTETLFQK